jgi:hypothetical protein
MTTTKLTKEEQEKISVDEYETEPIQVFVSYSSDDKFLAGRIKSNLEDYGLSVFLAHDDIPPTRDWQEEISKHLRECDVFIPILTGSFRQSNWTDQEVGMAFGLEKLIIPLKVDTDPYAFIMKLQAGKLDVRNLSRSCSNIISVLKDSQFSEQLSDCLLRALDKAGSFSWATEIIEELRKFETFNAVKLDQILRIAIRNNQFRMCSAGKAFLTWLIKNNILSIDPFLVQTYFKVKDSF